MVHHLSVFFTRSVDSSNTISKSPGTEATILCRQKSQVLRTFTANMQFLTFSFSLVLFALLLNIVQPNRVRHASNHALQQEFNRRVQQLSNWTCDVPKPRLVYLDDPTNNNGFVTEPNIVWIPVVAVLHRCDQSTGCCANHPRFTCQPIETESVSLVFQRIDVMRSHHSFEHFRFTNHTRCNCVSTAAGTEL